MIAVVVLNLLLAQPAPSAEAMALLQDAARFLAQGRPASGLPIVEDLLSRQGNLPEALVLKALLLDALDRPAQALAAYESALLVLPNDPRLLRLFGAHRLRERQWDEALVLLERSAKLGPDDALTLFLLAQAHFEKGNHAEAVHAIERCLRLTPDNAEARQARDRYVAAAAAPPAKATGVRSTASGTGQSPYSRIQEAKAYLDKGEPKRTLEIVGPLLEEYPRSPSGHLLRGLALDALGRFDEARRSYERALEIHPEDPQILASLGQHFLRAESWDEAVRYLERSNRAAEDAATLFSLAQAYFHTESKGKALEAIERCAALAPKDPAVLPKLGQYRAHASKFSPALEALRKAQALNPDEPGLDLALGIVNLSLLDIEGARTALERALGKDPESLAVLSNLAAACAKARDHAAAQRYFQKLLDLGQTDAHNHAGLGAALLGLGQNEAAIKALDQAVERDPKLAEAHFHLARAQRASGHADEAERELRLFTALKANPFQPFQDRADLEQSLWRKAESLVKQGKEGEALKLLAAGNAPGNEPTYLVGALYYSLGRAADALRLLTQALTLAPRLAKVRAYLGLSYLELGRLAEAEAVLSKELEDNPREPLVLMAVGQLHFRKRDWADAARYLVDSRAAEPSVLLMLCEAQLETGQRAQAQETAQILSALSAGDAPALASLTRLLARHQLRIEGPPG
jgi:tetratricopeptide (TPR) repeat protein